MRRVRFAGRARVRFFELGAPPRVSYDIGAGGGMCVNGRARAPCAIPRVWRYYAREQRARIRAHADVE